MSTQLVNPDGRTDLQTHTPGHVIQLEHSRVIFEHGPAGVIARVVHDSRGVDYAGPLDNDTIRALRDVARGVSGSA